MSSKKLVCAMVLAGVCAGMTGIGVDSADAAKRRTLTLKWAPDPQVIGYEIYFGDTPDRGKMRPLHVPYDLDLKRPSIKLNVLRDLKALRGQAVCFRIKAYDNHSKSAFSDAVCTST